MENITTVTIMFVVGTFIVLCVLRVLANNSKNIAVLKSQLEEQGRVKVVPVARRGAGARRQEHESRNGADDQAGPNTDCPRGQR